MKTLLFSLLFVIPVIAMDQEILEIQSPSLQYPSELGSLKLYHHQNRFIIDDNGKHLEIQRCDIDPTIRTLPQEKLLAYLATGYIRATKANNGDVILRAQQRIHGGGPVTASIFYWITKVACYSVASAAAGAGAVAITGAIVSTGGAAAGPVAVGVGVAVKSAAVATGMGAASGAIVAGAGATIGAAGGGTVATMATGSVITGAGGLAGAVAAVEGASCFMAALGMALPLP